jgi:hypothetical protein
MKELAPCLWLKKNARFGANEKSAGSLHHLSEGISGREYSKTMRASTAIVTKRSGTG